MPKPATRSDSTTDESVSVASPDINELVQAACEKAVVVLKSELMKMFADITARLETVEKRLAATEKKTTDLESGLNDLSNRIMEVQHTTDSLVDTGGAGSDGRLKEYLQEIEATKSEARAAICCANDTEQYGRRNNVRIRGLSLRKDDDCRSVVVSFLNDKLHANITSGNIEAAHVLPTRPEISRNLDQFEQSAESLRPKQGPPPIIVRFQQRDVRDDVLRKRRFLKNSQFAIVEDLTVLNAKTLSRVSKHPDIATAWSWNGKIIALKKSGEKVTVRPYQSLC